MTTPACSCFMILFCCVFEPIRPSLYRSSSFSNKDSHCHKYCAAKYWLMWSHNYWLLSWIHKAWGLCRKQMYTLKESKMARDNKTSWWEIVQFYSRIWLPLITVWINNKQADNRWLTFRHTQSSRFLGRLPVVYLSYSATHFWTFQPVFF